jgi:WD40 repeat protein
MMVSFDLSMDNKYLCIAGLDGNVKIISSETGKEMYSLKEGDEGEFAVNIVMFSPDNKYICAASRHGLCIWNNPFQYYKRALRDIFMKTRFFAETEKELGKGRLKLLGLDLQDNLLSSMRLCDFE